MVTSSELATRNGDGGTELFAGATPADVVQAARIAADALADVIKQQGLYKRIGGNDHVLVEGWQTLGAIVGVFAVKDAGVTALPWPRLASRGDEPPDPGAEPRRPDERPAWKAACDRYAKWLHRQALADAKDAGLTYGFLASFHAVKDGRQIGWAEGRVDRNETVWTTRDDHSLSSMAQTRAQSRALAAALKFVVQLSGYDATPADDMPPSAAAPTTVEVVQAPPELLGTAAKQDVINALQRVWPNVDAHAFMRVLAARLELDDVPMLAGRALAGWAWWQTQPQAAGNARETAPEPEPEPEDVP